MYNKEKKEYPVDKEAVSALLNRIATRKCPYTPEERRDIADSIIDYCLEQAQLQAMTANLKGILASMEAVMRAGQVVRSLIDISEAGRKSAPKSEIMIGFDDSDLDDDQVEA